MLYWRKGSLTDAITVDHLLAAFWVLYCIQLDCGVAKEHGHVLINLSIY